jgi:hypothetical protein
VRVDIAYSEHIWRKLVKYVDNRGTPLWRSINEKEERKNKSVIYGKFGEEKSEQRYKEENRSKAI